jgi:ADP-heptose:LPS heptosyltransferase
MRKKILLVNPFGIGDVLFTTPVIKSIKDSLPEAYIGYWCNLRTKDILKDNNQIDRIFALSRGDLKGIYNRSKIDGLYRFLGLLRRIKREKFDISLDFSLDYRYSLISKLLGIRKRVGFDYNNRGRFLTDKIVINGYQSKHAVDYYLDLLGVLNIEAKRSSLILPVTESSRLKIQSVFNANGIKSADLVIGVAPGAGASWGKEAYLKHWPAINFAQLSDRLINELGAKVVLLGDESERPICDKICGMMIHKPLDLTGRTSLEELSAAIERLKIMVTNDGGPLHMAVAAGIKTVSIFGPVDDLVYGPYPKSANHIVIKKDMPCRPCYRNFRMTPCQNDRECIRMVRTEEVFEGIRRIL